MDNPYVRLNGNVPLDGVAFLRLIDYNGVTHFRIFGGMTVIFTVSKRTTIFLLQTESKVVSFNL